MERCETCKWWDGPDGDQWGVCQRIVEPEWGDLHPKKIHPGAYMDIADDQVGGEFWTRHDFGCVLHEPREVSNDAAD